MIDTSSERLRLAMLVRELEKQLRQNMEAIFKPLVPHMDQAKHYFWSYSDYLKQAMTHPELPNREIFQRRMNSSYRVVNRDNLGALASEIGELAYALEASVSDIVKEREALKEKVSQLMNENESLRNEIKRYKADRIR